MTDAFAPETASEEYVYVRNDDGTFDRVRRSDIEPSTLDRAELSKQDRKVTGLDEKEPEWYVHLSNGDVERVAESDLPGHEGTNAQQGHWVKDGHAFLVIGVYPVENEVKEED
jgi:hypothetical protein